MNLIFFLGMTLIVTAFAIFTVAILSGVAYFIVSVWRAQNYWKKRNVYTLKTRVPILGHIAKMFSQKISFPEVIHVSIQLGLISNYNYEAILSKDFYKEIQDQGKDFGGIYNLKKRTLIVNDPKLIGEVTIKQFEHFVNRGPIVDERLKLNNHAQKTEIL